MDGVDVASTLAQLMAREPEDTWELVPEEDLASGHLDSCGFQYRLRGLSSACHRCQWWSSAHAHILFLLWLGLVKMRIRARCQLCPLDTRRDCQASLLSGLFLEKLVPFILPGEHSSDLCPQLCFGDLGSLQPGVCFCQKPPDPAWGPKVRSPSTIRAMPALGSHPWSVAPRALHLTTCPSPSESTHFSSEGVDIVTIPFTLVRVGRDKGCVGRSEAGPRGLLIVDRDSDQPASVWAPWSASGPHPPWTAPSSIKSFQVEGFIPKGFSSLMGQAGPGADPRGSGRPAGGAYLPMSCISGLTAKGEVSITLPSSLASTIQGPDSLCDIEGSLTFPFIITNKGRAGQRAAATPPAFPPWRAGAPSPPPSQPSVS
ncbi:LOW QUALITY PROTEIN: receptor-transporting protein 5 [Molossus nigricans]